MTTVRAGGVEVTVGDGDLDKLTTETMSRLVEDEVAQAIVRRDPSVWGPEAAPEAAVRLGWLDCPTTSRGLLPRIEALRGEIAAMRGQNEQLARNLSELQRGQRDITVGVEERLRKFEPSKVTLDGREFTADPAEARDFEASLAIFRRGDFPAAQTSFTEFLRRYPQSGYRAAALFWLGNAQYANRDYRGAVANFRALLAQAPEHARAPEALLSIANCQIELKDNPGARRTLEELTRTYPQSEAANAARERLARLR